MPPDKARNTSVKEAVSLIGIVLVGLGGIVIGVVALVTEPDLTHRTARGLPIWFGVLLVLTAGPLFLAAGIWGLLQTRR